MATMSKTAILTRWTNDLLESMPRIEGERYEIISGELYVTTQPHVRHQITSSNISFELNTWCRTNDLGRAFEAPGVVYAIDEAVAPDLVWVSKARLTAILGRDGKLHASPELVVEILSAGKANEERDRDKKLVLYSRHGVLEYWIVDWRAQTVEIYRRDDDQLQLAQTLTAGDSVSSPILPGFACTVERFFEL